MNLSAHNAGRARAGGFAPPSERAFSLIEIMLVLVLLAALAGLAVPTFETMLARATLRETAAQVASLIDEAGSDAARRGIALDVFAIPRETGEWALMAAPLAPVAADGEAPREGPTEASSQSPAPSRLLTKLPTRYQFAAGDNADAHETDSEHADPVQSSENGPQRLRLCILWPTGEATPLGTLRLEGPEGDSALMEVSALLGRCRVTFVAAAATPGRAEAAEKPAPRPAPALGAPEPDLTSAGGR